MSMSKICQGCEERSAACHDKCEKYQAASAEHKKELQWLRQQNETYSSPGVHYRKSIGRYECSRRTRIKK